MGPDGATGVVVAVVFVATLVRSTFGFGEALVAVPLLALVIPIDRAVPLATLVSVAVAAVVVLQDRDRIHVGSAARLVLATVAGIPLGLWLLTAGADTVVKAVLGGVIVAFSAFCLAGGVRAKLRTDRTAWAFGLAAGVLGGAYGMNGPPLVVYGPCPGHGCQSPPILWSRQRMLGRLSRRSPDNCSHLRGWQSRRTITSLVPDRPFGAVHDPQRESAHPHLAAGRCAGAAGHLRPARPGAGPRHLRPGRRSRPSRGLGPLAAAPRV
jgi:hypothetical protein